MPRIVLVFYLLIGLVNVVANAFSIEAVNAYTKPFLMPLLIFYIYRYAAGHITLPRLLLVGALIFSWIGDLLLMGDGDRYFIGGLGAFLFAQISYAVILYRSVNHRPKLSIVFLIPLLIYGVVLLLFILPNAGEMGIAIVVYAAAILSMVYMALLRTGLTSKGSYYYALAGALLFIVSDSLIAFDKFYFPIEMKGVWIMSTYITAQLLLVRGILLHRD